MEPQGMQAAAATTGLAGDIRVLIGEARAGLAATVNSALTMLYSMLFERTAPDQPGPAATEVK